MDQRLDADSAGVLVTGGFAGALDLGGSTTKKTSAGAADAFIAKLDGNLAAGSAAFLGDSHHQQGTAISAAPDRVAVVGDFAVRSRSARRGA